MLITALIYTSCCLAAAADPPLVVLDGRFEEWAETDPAVTDPADHPDDEIDFGAVRVAHDGDFLHLDIALGREVSIQQLDGHVVLLLDADGNPKTGRSHSGLEGTDLALRLTAPSQRRTNMGLALYAPTPSGEQRFSPYDAGVAFAPTHAGDRIELRIERNRRVGTGPPLFSGRAVRGKLVAYGADGTARDETEVFTHALGRTAPPPRPGEASDPLARPEATAVRVMSWNVEFARILETPAPFARSLRAVAPDIVLFQELKNDSSTAQLAALLEEAVPTGDDGAWTVVLGEGGGGLRCGVATRLPAEGAEALRVLPMPGSPDRTVRVAAIVAQVEGRPLLAASCHLKCCGRLGGREDATRMSEVETIAAGIAAARSAEGPEAIIVGGDLNLVGGRGPLERLGRGTDIDGSDLAIVEPLQIDGRTNATWEDPGQPFIPGRLDYLLHGDAGTRVVGTFVLDTRDLSEATLRRHDLRPRDGLASDHLPIVVDLAWEEGE